MQTITRYDVYFLGTDGHWRIQHSFREGTLEEREKNAFACAENLSRWATATVNEVEWSPVDGRVASEIQIAEFARKGAVA